MNDNFFDWINMVSFFIGILNLKENLTQGDKQDIMDEFDNKVKELLDKINFIISSQNDKINEINDKVNNILELLRGE